MPCGKCGQGVSPRAYKQHAATECPVPCGKCGQGVSPAKKQAHDRDLCPVACADCGGAVPPIDKSHHDAKVCPMPCGKCGTVATRATMAAHVRDVCPMTCVLCGKSIAPIEKAHHDTHECPITCALCGKKMAPPAKKHHDTHECPITCAPCGQTMFRHQKEHHDNHECAVPCQLCGTAVTHHSMVAHVDNDCQHPDAGTLSWCITHGVEKIEHDEWMASLRNNGYSPHQIESVMARARATVAAVPPSKRQKTAHAQRHPLQILFPGMLNGRTMQPVVVLDGRTMRPAGARQQHRGRSQRPALIEALVRHTGVLRADSFTHEDLVKIANARVGGCDNLLALVEHRAWLSQQGITSADMIRAAAGHSGAKNLAALKEHLEALLSSGGLTIAQVIRIVALGGGSKALNTVRTQSQALLTAGTGLTASHFARVCGSTAAARNVVALHNHFAPLRRLGYTVEQIVLMASRTGGANILRVAAESTGRLCEAGFTHSDVSALLKRPGGAKNVEAIGCSLEHLLAAGFNAADVFRFIAKDGAQKALPRALTHIRKLHGAGFSCVQVVALSRQGHADNLAAIIETISQHKSLLLEAGFTNADVVQMFDGASARAVQQALPALQGLAFTRAQILGMLADERPDWRHDGRQDQQQEGTEPKGLGGIGVGSGSGTCASPTTSPASTVPCRDCGSASHQRRTHHACPHNPAVAAKRQHDNDNDDDDDDDDPQRHRRSSKKVRRSSQPQQGKGKQAQKKQIETNLRAIQDNGPVLKDLGLNAIQTLHLLKLLHPVCRRAKGHHAAAVLKKLLTKAGVLKLLGFTGEEVVSLLASMKSDHLSVLEELARSVSPIKALKLSTEHVAQLANAGLAAVSVLGEVWKSLSVALQPEQAAHVVQAICEHGSRTERCLRMLKMSGVPLDYVLRALSRLHGFKELLLISALSLTKGQVRRAMLLGNNALDIVVAVRRAGLSIKFVKAIVRLPHGVRSLHAANDLLLAGFDKEQLGRLVQVQAQAFSGSKDSTKPCTVTHGKLPKGWKHATDSKSGRKYYWDSRVEDPVTQWERPAVAESCVQPERMNLAVGSGTALVSLKNSLTALHHLGLGPAHITDILTSKKRTAADAENVLRTLRNNAAILRSCVASSRESSPKHAHAAALFAGIVDGKTMQVVRKKERHLGSGEGVQIPASKRQKTSHAELGSGKLPFCGIIDGKTMQPANLPVERTSKEGGSNHAAVAALKFEFDHDDFGLPRTGIEVLETDGTTWREVHACVTQHSLHPCCRHRLHTASAITCCFVHPPCAGACGCSPTVMCFE